MRWGRSGAVTALVAFGLTAAGCSAAGEAVEASNMADAMRDCARFVLSDGGEDLYTVAELRLIVAGCTMEDERFTCTRTVCRTSGPDARATIEIDDILDDVRE